MRPGSEQAHAWAQQQPQGTESPDARATKSNGPDVKIRGTAQHVADKYMQLARDAQSIGRPGGGRELPPARRALLSHHHRGPGAVPEQFGRSFQQPAGRGRRRGGAPDTAGRATARCRGEADDDYGRAPQPYDGAAPSRRSPYDRQATVRIVSDRLPGPRPLRPGRPAGSRRPPGPRRRRDRFPRNDRPRQDFQRGDYQRPEGGPEGGRQDARQDERPEGGRDEGRPESAGPPRFDRDERRRDEAEPTGANGLPAFLTTPVRTPIAVGEPESDDGIPPATNGAAPHGRRAAVRAAAAAGRATRVRRTAAAPPRISPLRRGRQAIRP